MPILKPEERLGSKLAGKYRLDRVLGKGGFGVVFAGVHEWTGREIAAKILNHDLAEQDLFVRRFLQEARSAAKIDHPNVVGVLDMGQDADGTVYLVLELLKGEELSAILRRLGPLEVDDALEILIPVMDALGTAHMYGIVHRDLKPDNIFVSVDPKGHRVPKLLDFGIAKTNDSSATQTHTGVVIGTPHYMAPEQARAIGAVGPEADVWSMGVVLWQCLTGTRPFDADSATGVLADILTRRATPIRRVKPSIPKPIARTIDRALTYEREKRYPHMHAFREAIEAAQHEPHDEAESYPMTGPIPAPPPLLPPPGEPFEATPPPRERTPAPRTPAQRTPARHTPAPRTPEPRYESTQALTPPSEQATPAPPPEPEPGRVSSVLLPVLGLAAIGAAVLCAVLFWPSDPVPPPVARATAPPNDEPEPDEPPVAEPDEPSEPSGPSASERARECSAAGDHRCVVEALGANAESAADLAVLIDSYRSLGDRAQAQRHMSTFIERYPDTPRAAQYREQLARRERRRPVRAAEVAVREEAPSHHVGANRAPVLH